MKYAGRDLRAYVQITAGLIAVPGERTTAVTIGTEQVDSTGKDDGSYRQLSPCGISSASVKVAGVCRDDLTKTEFNQLYTASVMGDVLYVEVVDGGGNTVLAGQFLVQASERNGEYNGAEMYDFQFQSTGAIQSSNLLLLEDGSPLLLEDDEPIFTG